MFEEEKNPTIITRDELRSIVSDTLDNARLHKIRTENPNFTREEISNERKRRLEEFKNNLINDKDKFKRVFETEQESTYFQLNDGSCLRIKQSEQGPDIKPIMQKVFFVTAEQSDKLVEMRKNDTWQIEMIGHRIETTDFSEGVVPIEFGQEQYPPIDYSEDENGLTINADEYGGYDRGFHIGHQVKKIY